MRRNVALMLELEGHHVLVAGTGSEGLEMARLERPDLILCDVMLPGLDGHEVLKAVRGDAGLAATRFVFLTARGDSADVRAGLALGADGYLSKPVTREELVGAVTAPGPD